MTKAIDPLENIPDPDQRHQVFGFLRGSIPFIQIIDSETGSGFVLDVVTALEVARDINAQAVHALTMLGKQENAFVDPDSINEGDPFWQRDIWRRSSEN